jgi:phosphoadenosine phosphosulfate reductase
MPARKPKKPKPDDTSAAAANAQAELIRAIGRHEPGSAAFSFSGGKDSTAVAFLLERCGLANHVTVYCVDTGDLLPETREVIEAVAPMFPHFVRIQTDAADYMRRNGLPSDLVPYHSHPIGRAIGQAKTPLVSRYDCCWFNIMLPVMRALKQRRQTLLIRGTKAGDVPKLPIGNGQASDGLEMCYPLQDWSDADVFAYLREQNAPISPVYERHPHGHNSLDCATCPAWWTDRRGAYLKSYHPELFELYAARFSAVTDALGAVFDELVGEHEAVSGGLAAVPVSRES